MDTFATFIAIIGITSGLSALVLILRRMSWPKRRSASRRRVSPI